MQKIYFYEMSNIDGKPYVLDNVNDFYDFCNRCNIKVTGSNRNFINSNSDVYAICKQSKAELVLSKDYKNLRKNFSKANRRWQIKSQA